MCTYFKGTALVLNVRIIPRVYLLQLEMPEPWWQSCGLMALTAHKPNIRSP